LLGLLLRGAADLVVEVVEELMAAVVGADRVGAIPNLIDPAVGVDDPAGALGGLDALGRVDAEAKPVIHGRDLHHMRIQMR